MAVGRIRAIIIIVLFATSLTIPILMETAIVPILNVLNYFRKFYTIKPDGSLEFKWDQLLSSLKGIECNSAESNENQTVLEITLKVENLDPSFDMLVPGVDMTVYWKAGLPYEREKQTILNWISKPINASQNLYPEPKYDGRRWTRVIGLKIDPLRVRPNSEQLDLKIKIYLFNDRWGQGQSSALGQMIGTLLRTKSTKDPYTGESLMHLKGSASLDFPGISFPLDLELGLDLSSLLNMTSLLGGMSSAAGVGGANLFNQLFDVQPSILDIQNYNDSNGNFIRDAQQINGSYILDQNGQKKWTEELFHNGALSAFMFMKLKDKLGIKNLDITLLKSSYNPDAEKVNLTWHPNVERGSGLLQKEFITNQLFLYLPNSSALADSKWRDKIFGVFGFPHDIMMGKGQSIGDFSKGQVVAGGTIRLTGDLRKNSNFSLGVGLGALITQAIQGILPLGIFGSIDLKLNKMPLSICLNLPLEINLSSFLGATGVAPGGDLFSTLMNYLGLKTTILNGLAYDTYNGVLQLNFNQSADMFMPYGIYMPPTPECVNGTYKPYIGIGGGPLQIFDDKLPTDWSTKTMVEKNNWKDEHLIMNITSLNSPTFEESMAKLMATIGRSGAGNGIAYLFDDGMNYNGNYGSLIDYIKNKGKGQLPNPQTDKSSFSFTEDQFKLALNEITPKFGKGFLKLTEQIGIDPLFIEYLNNSLPHTNSKSILEDLLSVRQLLNLLYQPGPKNDIFDYLMDSSISNCFTVDKQKHDASYLETARVLNQTALQLSHDGVKAIKMIFNGTYNPSTNSWGSDNKWNISQINFTSNGLIISKDPKAVPFLSSNPPQVMYITNKLALFDLANLTNALLEDLLFTNTTAGTGVSSLLAEIFKLLPGTLNAMGIDFDRILPNLIKYLRVNISQPPPIGYGIKPFEMIDIAYNALMGSQSGATGLSTLLTGPSGDLINNIIKEVATKFIEQADPFQLMHATFNDLAPILDYLNRSRLFSREVLLPLVASLFPSGSSLATGTEETVSLEDIINMLMPLVQEMLLGGNQAHFAHQALNPFAMLSAPECIVYKDATELSYLRDSGYPVYQVGMGNYVPDYPKYDNLRLMSNISLGLLLSGFTAADIWSIINQLGLIDLSGAGGDVLAGLKSLISLLGSFVPSTQWDSLLRELGIWSTWEGQFDQFLLNAWVFGIHIINNMDARSIVGNLINLEQLLATGQIIGQQFVQLCLYENQSYGNPYCYIPGYDTSGNKKNPTGPYRQSQGGAATDNWGWAPLNWDPGGYTYSSVTGSPYPAQGDAYSKSFISRLISTVPVQLDFDVLTMNPVSFQFSFIYRFLGFNIPITFGATMRFSPQLFGRIRLEGNPSQLMALFEQQGIPLMGLASHYIGGDLASLVNDLLAALIPSPTSNATTSFPSLDVTTLLQAFLNAKVDIMDYYKFMVDPEFMKASQWYLDPSYLNISSPTPTLIWDKNPKIPGDNDSIPDEYPWYRFLMPIFNQDPDWVEYGPGSLLGRNPKLVDRLTPAGPPGSGKWWESPDGIPDGIQHYWYDTPYAYVNTTVKITDPWVWVPPLMWNDKNVTAENPNGYYIYTVPGYGKIIWGDDKGEQLPLLNISDAAWDITTIPTLYYVPSKPRNWTGTWPGVVGTASIDPNINIPILKPGNRPVNWVSNQFPNIWNCFNVTLNQTDYRFGYWTTKDDSVLGKKVRYLETQPFYDLLSYAFYPQLPEMLDWLAPLVTQLVVDMLSPSIETYSGNWGYDYYHLLRNSTVYSKFGIDALQPLDIFGMLQWLWDGAGQRWNGTQLVPYIEPYSTPNLQGTVDWLADHGFTMEFLIKNLDKIFSMFSETGASGITVDLTSGLASLFTPNSIVSMIRTIEDYFREIVAGGNRTKATLISLNILKDMITIFDINPAKVLRGTLNYLMPQLTGTGATGGSTTNLNQLKLGTFLKDSGLMSIIFKNQSKLSNTKFTIGIYQSSINLYLFGQNITNVPLNLGFDIDLAQLFGGGKSGGASASDTNVLNNLPISFPSSGFPYIELSTFNGPFNITFQLYNTSLGGGRSPIRNTNVTIGEVCYDETTGVYYFNRTQSSFEFENSKSGWQNPDANGIPRTFMRPHSLLRSDPSGFVSYSSVISEDNFGWVDPYIYIHVESPNDYPTQQFYWWNVTCHPTQYTLAGNRPPYKAPWVTDGKDILVQSRNTLPSNVLEIDNDPYLEIFARVEIDGRRMPTHEIVYVKMGSVGNVSVDNITGGQGPVQVQINASYVKTTQDWPISLHRDQTKYVFNQEITPTGTTLTYPTISQIISGFAFTATKWDDDSLYSLKVDYISLNGTYIPNLYTYQLPKVLGSQSGSVTYNQTKPGFSWIPSAPTKLLTLRFSPTSSATQLGNYRYAFIDINATNFEYKTIRSVTVDLNVTHAPDRPNESEWVRPISENYQFTKPSVPTTYYFFQDVQMGGLTIKGSTPLENKNATSAWFDYTVPIDGSSFLNGINCSIGAQEFGGRTSIANVIIQYYNSSNSQWYTTVDLTPGTKIYNNYFRDFGLMKNKLRNPHTGSFINSEDLYLTARNSTYPFGRLFESVTKVRFAVRIIEPGSPYINDGIGYSNDGLGNITMNFNSNVSVSFVFYPFVKAWSKEIPEGFVNNFRVNVTMYDPLNYLSKLNSSNVKPNVVVQYYRMGPLKQNIAFNISTGDVANRNNISCQGTSTITGTRTFAAFGSFSRNVTATKLNDGIYHSYLSNSSNGLVVMPYYVNLHDFGLSYDNIRQVVISIDGKISYRNGTIKLAGCGLWNWSKGGYKVFPNYLNSTSDKLSKIVIDNFDKTAFVTKDRGRIELFILINTTGPPVNVSIDLIQFDVKYIETFFARKIIFRLEAWDSLVRQNGDHGDILFKDNFNAGTEQLVPLPASYLPTLNTMIKVVDVEAKVRINVTIPARQTLRNYYLKMNINTGDLKIITLTSEGNSTITGYPTSARNFSRNITATFNNDGIYHAYLTAPNGLAIVPYYVNLHDSGLLYDNVRQVEISIDGKISYSNNLIKNATVGVWNWNKANLILVKSNILNSTSDRLSIIIIDDSNKTNLITKNGRIELFVFINTTGAPVNVSIDLIQFNVKLGYEGRGYTNDYRFSVSTDINFRAMSKIGAYPSKKVLISSALNFPISLQVGLADLEPYPNAYKLFYILTFKVSPEFLINTTAREKFIFTPVWEKSSGTYQILPSTDKNTLEPVKIITIVYK